MESAPLSFSRKFLLWFMNYPPFSPYASFSAALDFTTARGFLDALKNGGPSGVTVQHLVSAALARTYAEFPAANASVFGHRIEVHEQVGIMMPVDHSLKHDLARPETGLVLVERAQSLSLRALAESTRREVQGERDGTTGRGRLAVQAERALGKLPFPLMWAGLDGLDRLSRIPGIGARIHRYFPMTTVVTNVGASVGIPGGVLCRSAHVSPPRRFMGLGTLLGVMPIQNEVVAIGGQACVRPMLPLMYVFDHRLFDGVMCGRILTRLSQIIENPAAVFGEDGAASGPDLVGGAAR